MDINETLNMKVLRSFISKKTIATTLAATAFVVGLLLPSPLSIIKINDGEKDTIVSESQLVDTMNMVLPDGSIYNGTLVKGTTTREGYGRLSIGETSYEGEWKNDKLPYGQRITPSSVYNGEFNDRLQNDGFGIIEYTENFINAKKAEGKSDAEIASTYTGNWKDDIKQGLGRSKKVDNSIEFGHYIDGVCQTIEGANYNVGDKIYGIDISHYQSNIDWDNLALYCDENGQVTNDQNSPHLQPVFFVFLKATEGATYKDETYSRYSALAKKHGIVHGAYHVFHLKSNTEDQVKNFIETTNWVSGDLPPVLDIEYGVGLKEYGKDRLTLDVLYWLESVEQHLHVKPIIYTGERVKNEYLDDIRFNKYKFWIAKYREEEPTYSKWNFWQRSDKGVVSGYRNTIDIDQFHGDYNSFMKYLKFPYLQEDYCTLGKH